MISITEECYNNIRKIYNKDIKFSITLDRVGLILSLKYSIDWMLKNV